MKLLSDKLDNLLLNQLAFYTLLASGAFIILLWSPNVLGEYLTYWEKIIIYILPWLMMCLAYSWQVFTCKTFRPQIILIVAIIILGIVNTVLSDAVSKSIPQMRTFLLTGIFAFWAAMFLLTGERRRRVFDRLCLGCLAIILPVELIVWMIKGISHGALQIFALHPIPLGSLIILLSTGPIHLLAAKSYKTRMGGGLLLLLAGIVIFATHKRGTVLALAVMLAVGLILLLRRRKYLVLLLIMVFALLFSYQGRRYVARLDPNVPHLASVMHRLEFYNFALHIWETHPVMGIGLRPFTHAKYLQDYHQYNKNLTDFRQSVTNLQTFDNMVLTAFVELGTLMTLAYLGLVMVILARYVRALWSSPSAGLTDWYRILVIFGLGFHSLSYDSLLFPPVNWLFHVQLGLMAAYPFAAEALGPVMVRTKVQLEGSI
jgi:O-antigen ligase